jgi:hypothetical protein
MLIPPAEDAVVPLVAGELVPIPEAVAQHPAARPEPDGRAVRRDGERKLTNHGGGPLAAESDFFIDPPREIGPILSAHTTLTVGKKPWSPGARLIATGLAGLAGLASASAGVLLVAPRAEFWYVGVPTVGSLLGAGVAFGRTRYAHTCSYVGRDGVAKFTCAGNRDRITGAEVFSFRDAAELRTGQTKRYVNGAYQGTDYFFTWTDVGGRKRYQIDGTYQKAKGTPPASDPYHFGLAAEMAWTGSLLSQAQRQVELAGEVAFSLTGGQCVRLAPGRMTLQLGGEPLEWPAAEIEAVVVDKGQVKVKRADAKEGWFSATGVAKFPFDRLANARLFFFLVDRLLGVRVG